MAKETDIDKDLETEIDAGVEAAVKVVEESHRKHEDESSKAGKKVTESDADGSHDDESLGEEYTVAEKGDTSSEAKAEDTAIDDTMIERAVKAGMSMTEVRQYPNAGLLTVACNRLEASLKKPDDGSRNGADKGDKKDEEKDPLAEIPDLDPDEYDEKIVNGFKALKGIIRQQHETIKSMSGNQDKDWFSSQVDGLGITEALKAAPEKRDALKAKFDVLTAGYKAVGQDVDRAEVLQEAARLTVADDITAASEADKKAKLAKRAGQQISRPSGHRQQPKGNAFEEVAEELDRKFFDRK